ncbi:MAG: Gldg family protein [Pseudohongiellaceae bacterium]
MNSKSLFSSAGLLSIAVFLLLSVAIISLIPSLRIDLTEDRLYSLSDGTRNILSNLNRPIEMIFFYSDEATADVPQIRSYAVRVQELMREMSIASNGNLRFSVVDPEPFSEEEDLATRFGIQAVPISQGGEGVYFGLVVAEVVEQDETGMAPRISETMGLIRPDQEEFLEYEFMKLVTRVENPDRQIVGILTDLDMDGGFNPAFGQATPPWTIMDVVRQLYETRRIDMTTGEIDQEIDILMIVHPVELSEKMLYAVDQHVLRHGKAMVFLDPNADSLIQASEFGVTIPAGVDSDLPTLLSAWGVSYDSSQVLTDSELALRVVFGQGQRPVPHLGMLGIQSAGLTFNDVITSRLESVNASSTGVISPMEGATTRFEPLIQSSSNAMLMDAGLMQNVTDPSILFDEFESADQRYVIAARVSGMISTAFPDGPPLEDSAVEEEVAEAVGNTDAATDTVQTPAIDAEPVPEHLTTSNAEVNLIIVADTDLLSDRMWVQVAQFLGQRIPQPFANNGDFVVNALDNLSGSADLVSIRSRGRYSRPFTRVLDLQRQADDQLRMEETALLESLAATEERLNELSRDENDQLIPTITPEVQQEIDRVNEEILATRGQLRDVQHQLNEDIEQLGSRLKAINTGLVPLLLTILMLTMGYLRTQRRRQSA